MTVDTNTMVSITEANQNFSKVARLVDELGSVVILKNNAPRYLVIDFSKADDSAIAHRSVGSGIPVLPAYLLFLLQNSLFYTF